jgi:excisionase family DNA binding protein
VPPRDPVPISEAAERLGLTARALFNWIHDKKIAGWKLPGDRRTYVDWDEIQRVRGWRRIGEDEPAADDEA